MCCNQKKRKYVDGAIYTDVFSEAAHIIDVPDNEIVELKILTAQKKVSSLSIYFERKSDLQHLKNCCKLGQILSNYKGNTFRKKCFDDGEIYIIGQGKVGNGSTGSYKMTEYPGVENVLKNLTESSKNYYKAIGFRGDKRKKIAFNTQVYEKLFCIKQYIINKL